MTKTSDWNKDMVEYKQKNNQVSGCEGGAMKKWFPHSIPIIGKRTSMHASVHFCTPCTFEAFRRAAIRENFFLVGYEPKQKSRGIGTNWSTCLLKYRLLLSHLYSCQPTFMIFQFSFIWTLISFIHYLFIFRTFEKTFVLTRRMKESVINRT